MRETGIEVPFFAGLSKGCHLVRGLRLVPPGLQQQKAHPKTFQMR